MALDLWSGASDLAWSAWLHHNNLVEWDEYREETLTTATIEIEYPTTPRIYEFNPSGDSETWVHQDVPIIGKRPYRTPDLHKIWEQLKPG